MSFAIAGIGTAVPEHAISQEDAARHAVGHCCETDDDVRRLNLLYRRSNVQSRGSVLLHTSEASHPSPQSFFPHRQEMPRGPSTSARMRRYEAEALPLCVRATEAALEEGGVSASEVTHLVTVSCTGFSAPGIDLGLIRALRLRASTQRTHVGFMGCHGVMNGLRLADAFSTADRSACVVVCAVELCTLHHQYGWQADRVLANALFADGAAAAVGTGAGHRPTDGWRLRSSASMFIPDTADLMSWHIGDHGFEMTLSPEVPAVIENRLRPWLSAWLADQGRTIDQIGSWAIHPGGPKILESTARAAGFDPSLLDDSREVLSRHGNMSSPTILFVLDRLRRREAPRPCVALAFGPGLSLEAALFE